MAVLMRRRQLCVCLCLLLLLAVAPPAPMVVGEGECYWTAMQVPSWCRAEFIKALLNNNPNELSPMCCLKLVCVRDHACFKVLSEFCDYWKWIGFCKFVPPLRTSKSLAPAPSPGHHH